MNCRRQKARLYAICYPRPDTHIHKPFDARRIESGQRNTPQKSEETRPAFYAAYDALVEALNALALVNGDSKYLELFTWWNAMIDEFRVSVSLRLGKGKGGKTDGGNSNRPNPDAGGGDGESDGDKPTEL